MDDKLGVLVITAPSGTGKTTLNRRLVRELSNLEISVSLTTRSMRKNEKHGDHYWFISKEEFEEKLSSGKMLEWAEVFGNLYGTSLDEMHRIQANGKRPVLEIDVQGWEKAKDKLPNATSIFIMPPSMRALWERLKKRGTDPLEVRLRRIHTAREELDHGKHYQYFVINDDLDRAYLELKQIVLGREPTLDRQNGLSHCQKLLNECKEPWFAELHSELETMNQ
ncbi:MAG: guanylate kinase [Oligoflexales bacterium]|nr:guanylate kinase [Oligoflexales bacterium]